MARILIVEDDAALAELMSQVLQDEGHETQLATSLDQAQDVAQRQPVDLVVADLVEADQFGSENVVARLAAVAAGRPLLLCTGQPQAPRYASVPGVATVIEKPFDLDDLLARVREALEAAE